MWAGEGSAGTRVEATGSGGSGPTFRFSDKPANLPKAFEAIVSLPDAASILIGGIQLRVKDGKLSIRDGATTARSIPVVPGAPLDLAGTLSTNSVFLYANGKPLGKYSASSPPVTFQIGKSVEPWDGVVVGLVTYKRALTAAEIARSNEAAQAYAIGFLAPTPTATLKLRLGAFTPVPDPARMKPYRQALIAQEYTVLATVRGRLSGVKRGDKIRVFRFGVVEGKKTALKDMKSGDLATVTLELLSADPNLEREYQLDTLDTSYGAYFVEVPRS
jgi:hypothetical protein